jgi:hypothetical protein
VTALAFKSDPETVIAQIQQHFSDAAHASAADTDKMTCGECGAYRAMPLELPPNSVCPCRSTLVLSIITVIGQGRACCRQTVATCSAASSLAKSARGLGHAQQPPWRSPSNFTQ